MPHTQYYYGRYQLENDKHAYGFFTIYVNNGQKML